MALTSEEYKARHRCEACGGIVLGRVKAVHLAENDPVCICDMRRYQFPAALAQQAATLDENRHKWIPGANNG